MGGLSISHWLIILVVLLIFFGPSRLPGLGKSLGEAIKGFKEGLDAADDTAPKANPQPPPQQIASSQQAPSAQNVQNSEPVKKNQDS